MRKISWVIAAAILAIAGVMVLWLYDSGSRNEDAAPISGATVDSASVAAVDEADTSAPPVERGMESRGADREVTAAFPNGVNIPVRLRNVPHPGAPVSGNTARLIDFYDQLAERARAGEARAAYELSRQLQRCKEALAKVGPRDPESGQEELLEFCSGIDAARLEEAPMWRQLAVDAGYYWAWQDWARGLRGTPKELEAWNTLWERGYFTALQGLQIAHTKGVAGSPPDYVSAYAYKLIEFHVMQAALKDSLSPTYRNWLIAVEESLRHSGSYLTPAETEAAIALAVELLMNNPKCCIGRWNG